MQVNNKHDDEIDDDQRDDRAIKMINSKHMFVNQAHARPTTISVKNELK